LNILHIEDSPEDSELITRLLVGEGFKCQVTRVDSRPEVFEELEKKSYDLILADCRLPDFSGLRALEIAHALKPEIPFVFVSGTIGEETAIESLRNGATDYVLKDRLSRLAPAVRRALAEAEERTMVRQLQQRLREAGRLEAISTLANGIAHDFNNILTIILGHASLLEIENRQPDRVLKISGTIAEAARRGSEIVQQLLAFARKSDGHAALADLNRYLSAHLSALREKLPPTIELAFHGVENLPGVLIDAGQIDRMLANLIVNSVDAMPQGGRITLSTRLVAAREIPDLLMGIAADDYVCLTVADTGRGIDANTREHVFEPFFTTKQRGHGTGLGLPVVYGLMQAHQGFVDVTSEIDKGTSVDLYFPVPRQAEAIPPSAARSSDPALTGSETILVVEDEVDVGFFLETILQTHGYRVLLAGDAEQAVKLFQENHHSIELIFSDIGLPRVDGIELAARLRRIHPGIPIILASGYPTKEFKDRINALGIQAFLSKPYHSDDILRSVRTILNGAQVLHLA
jgi:signal transduction histidine kinase